MRHPAALAFGLIVFISLGSSAQDAKLAVTNYDLHFQIFTQDERLQGEAKMTIENRSATGVNEVPILLYRLLDIDSVTGPDGKVLPFQHSVVKLSDATNMQVNAATVRLPVPLPPRGQ
jgi:hypothetical protein